MEEAANMRLHCLAVSLNPLFAEMYRGKVICQCHATYVTEPTESLTLFLEQQNL